MVIEGFSAFFRQSFMMASLISLLVMSACVNYEILMEDLGQREANEVLVLLRDKGIDAKKEGLKSRKNVSYQIKVKRNQEQEALRLLVHNHLPRVERASLKDIYPPNSSGLIPSKSDEMARLLMAMQGEIEALLKVIPGILDVRVVFSYEQPSDFMKAPQKKSASVAIIYRPLKNSKEPPLTNEEIKYLISSSMSGITPTDVTVVQKLLQSIDYLEMNDHTAITTSVKEASLEHKNSISLWYLLFITILAVLVATYGVFRLFFQRRAAL